MQYGSRTRHSPPRMVTRRNTQRVGSFQGRRARASPLRGKPAALLAAVGVAALLFGPFGASSSRAADAVALKVGGTGSAIETIKQIAEAFQARQPGVRVQIVEHLGTRGGIRAVLKGALDIALTGRALREDELAQGLQEVEYARSPFVFVAHLGVGEVNLTYDMIARIYGGDLRTWPDGAPIRVILRPEGDVDTLLLRAISPALSEAQRRAAERPGMSLAMDDHENCDLLEKIPGSFGTSTLTQIVSERRALRVLPLNGVAPDLDTMTSGRYPHSKTFRLVTSPRPVPPAREFIDFVRSPAGGTILMRSGNLVPGTR